MNAKISIIIPCYNVELYIQRCIDSLVAQTVFTDMELILVNDASTDHTLDILLTNEKKHEAQIIVVNLEKNMGISVARNTGMQYASGDYVGFVDGDDFCAEPMYERLRNRMDSNKADFSVCGINKVTDSQLPVFDEVYEDSFIDLSCLQERKQAIGKSRWSTSACNKLYRKSFLEENKLTFPIGVRYEDTYFSCLVFACANSAYEVKGNMYQYFFNKESIMRGGNAVSQLERIEADERLMLELKKRNLLKPYYSEWEMVFIKKYYTEILNLLVMAFEHIPYEIYLHICEYMHREFPDFQNNKYLCEEQYAVERLYLNMYGLTEELLRQSQQILLQHKQRCE